MNMRKNDTPQQNGIVDQACIFCVENKERLTRPRLEVLKIIAANTKPLGAYEILERLGKVIDSPKPPTAYRAIEFWQKKGFIHRIRSLNAYVICHAVHRHKGEQFMICDDCGVVTETHIYDFSESLKNRAEDNTFIPSSWYVEIHGQCAQCQTN